MTGPAAEELALILDDMRKDALARLSDLTTDIDIVFMDVPVNSPNHIRLSDALRAIDVAMQELKAVKP